MVDRLEKAGYVQRTRSTTDRRLVLVEIVWGEPLRKLMSYFEPVAELTAGTLADYSDDQLEFLAAFIERGNEAFGFSPSTATTPNSNDTHQQS
jgi:DNA-binding MarR family transcriptional regulator